MATSGKHETYSKGMIALHWLTAVIMILLVAAVLGHEAFPKDSAPRKLLMMTHFSLGLSVLALVLIRVSIRARETVPEILPDPSALVHLASKAAHLGLYAVMFVMPVLGYLMMNAKGRAVPFFGIPLPILIGEDKPFGDSLAEVHETIGWVFIGLVIVHAVAAVLHHHYYKDNTLVRMMPARKTGVA
jgi:superoxide oxidase